jgi:photosystem II stability/assembly factor-like uncharacterized protein
MKRIITVLIILVAALSVTIWLAEKPGRRGKFTMEEISRKIKDEKTELKAELAARGKPYEPGMFPNEWGYIQRAYPYDRLDFDQLKDAIVQARAMRLAARKTFSTLSADWVEEGPTNIGARVTDLAIHPTNPDIVYAAHASSGVFKTVDGGATWYPITDDLPVLTIGAIALDPENQDVVYVGTGEANANSYSFFGMGMFKSTDAGATWNYIGLEETRYIARIVVDPLNTERIWVAATGALFGTNPERGVYRSEDAGETWDLVLSISDSTAATDIAIDPARPDTVFAAMWERRRGLTYRKSGGLTSGIWRSYDGGDTWVELTTGLPKGTHVGRIGLSVCASSPNVIYAIYDDRSLYEAQVYKSVNGGNSWVRTNDGSLTYFYYSYGWYFGQVRVDPGNPDRAFAMGVFFYRTEDGGDSWYEVGPYNHVDHHAMAFDPTDYGNIIDGNDGGLYYSGNSGTSWVQQLGQHTNQFYAIEIDYLNPQRLYGGTQDNGTLRTPTGATDDWERILGGDGFYAIVDPTDSDIIYAEYQNGYLYKSYNFGYSWYEALDGVSGYANWMMPVVMDPSNNLVLYLGRQQVFKTIDGANSWSAISIDLTNGYANGFGTITTIAVAPTDPDVIFVGTDDSNVWRTTNGGSLWTKISDPLPNRWVTRVAVDPTDASVIYVTFSGLRWNEEIGYVYRTPNAGLDWNDITGNLPPAPVNVIVVDPEETSRLFVGTDVGCYYTEDLGGTWLMLGTALPPVPVYDLKLHNPTRSLVAGTHGRSMYSYDLTGLPDLAGTETRKPDYAVGLSNYPNPFTETTSITFTLPAPSEVSLEVYDLAGRKVRSLESGPVGAGEHGVQWDGRNDAGQRVASGIYFARLQTESSVASARLNLIK